MNIDPFVGLTIYSTLATLPQVKLLPSIISEKFYGLRSYEKTLFKCYSKAVKKEVRKKYGFSLKRLSLKWEIALLEDALTYFTNDNINAAKELLEEYYDSNKISFNSIKENFEACLKKHSDFPLLTHIVIEGFKSQEDRIKSLFQAQEISDELKYRKTFDVTLKTIEEKISNGELLEAYYRIKSIIDIDELNRAVKFKNKIILFETKIILMRELKDGYKLQFEKLNSIENSFLKFYYGIRLLRHLKEEKGIEDFINTTGSQEYSEELKLSYLHLTDSHLEYIKGVESKFSNIAEESKIIILKNYLVSCINSFNSDYSEEFITSNQNLLSDYESRFYFCILKLNKFWKSKSIAEFSISEISFLQSSLEEMMTLKSKFKEYSFTTQSSINYNIALTKIYLDQPIKAFEAELDYFITDSELLLRFIKGLNSFRRFKDTVHILYDSQLKIKPGIIDEYINALFKDFNFEGLVNEKFTDIELSIDSKAKIVTAQNILLHKEKKGSFSESEIELLPDDPDHPIVLEAICEIFIINKDKSLAEKYFNKLYQNINKYDEQDKLVIMKLAELLGKWSIEEKIIDDLISIRAQYKVAKAKYYQRISNHFNNYMPQVDHFFSSISVNDDLPIEIIRIKSDYLQISGETDKFLILTKHLIDFYDNEGDWYVYIGSLIDLGKFALVEKLIPEIEKRLDNPLFELLLSICYLNTEILLEKKLIKFYFHFFQAFRKIKSIKQKFSEEILPPILNTLLINQLYLKYDKKYVSEGCFVQLTKKDGTDKQILCIHENKELSVPIENDYLNAKHLHKDDAIVKQILLSEIGNEVLFLGKLYVIDKIESILNYPGFFISELVYSNPEKFGLKKFEVGPDPVVTMYPQMLEVKQRQDQVLNKYSIKKLTIYILAGSNYLNYVQVIQRLLFHPNLSFNAGLAKNYKSQKKFVLSYTSLLILELFDKLRTIPEDKIIIPKSLIDAVNKHYHVMRGGIDNSKLSLDLDENLIPYKIETSPDVNLKETQRWQKFLSRITKYESFDTSPVEDDLIPLIRLVGKIEVDCIRISRLKQIPIILDDHLVQEFIKFNSISNSIGLYFFHSGDGLEEKLRLMLALSQMNYKYLLFDGLIEEIITQIFSENYTLFGNNTVIGNFIELIKYELNKEDKNLQYVYFLNGCNLLVTNYLYPTAERILKNLISLIRIKDKNGLFEDLTNLNQNSEEKTKFIRYCFS